MLVVSSNFSIHPTGRARASPGHNRVRPEPKTRAVLSAVPKHRAALWRPEGRARATWGAMAHQMFKKHIKNDLSIPIRKPIYSHLYQSRPILSVHLSICLSIYLSIYIYIYIYVSGEISKFWQCMWHQVIHHPSFLAQELCGNMSKCRPVL